RRRLALAWHSQSFREPAGISALSAGDPAGTRAAEYGFARRGIGNRRGSGYRNAHLADRVPVERARHSHLGLVHHAGIAVWSWLAAALLVGTGRRGAARRGRSVCFLLSDDGWRAAGAASTAVRSAALDLDPLGHRRHRRRCGTGLHIRRSRATGTARRDG